MEEGEQGDLGEVGPDEERGEDEEGEEEAGEEAGAEEWVEVWVGYEEEEALWVLRLEGAFGGGIGRGILP